jgi:Putative metal-binding motif
VWALDGVGNVSGASSREFKIVNRPQTSITGTPANGALVNTRTTAFGYDSTVANNTSFLCSLDGSFVPCNADLNAGEGGHTLSVQAGISPAGIAGGPFYDPSPATRTWTVDTVRPVTALTGGPDAGEISNKRDVTFTFGQTDVHPGTFQCALDSPGFGPCPGGEAGKAKYTGLSLASHTFKVRSTDAAGNVENTPKVVTWKITADVDNDGSPFPTDCDDANAAIHPGAPEILDNNVDENCDGVKGVNLDRDRDGSNRPADCDDANPGIRPGAPEILDDGIDQNCDGDPGVNPDRDGDGVQRPADCDDANAAIHPGAKDKPGNSVDEDCVGGPADYARPGTTLSSSWAVIRGRTVFPVFKISGAPKGAKVTLACKGKGCTFKSKKVKLRKGKANLRKVVKKLRLAKGATLTLKTVAPDMLVYTIRIKVARNGTAKASKLCARPGQKKTFSCG